MSAQAMLSINGLTVRFGGLTAVDDLYFEVGRGLDPRPDRPQWGRQVHHLQLHFPLLRSLGRRASR